MQFVKKFNYRAEADLVCGRARLYSLASLPYIDDEFQIIAGRRDGKLHMSKFFGFEAEQDMMKKRLTKEENLENEVEKNSANKLEEISEKLETSEPIQYQSIVCISDKSVNWHFKFGQYVTSGTEFALALDFKYSLMLKLTQSYNNRKQVLLIVVTYYCQL